MKNRKLVILHTECVSSRGGEKYIFEISNRLSKHMPVTLCLETISPYWTRRYQQRGIEIAKIWKPRFGYWLFIPLAAVINYYGLRRVVGSQAVVFTTNFPLNFLGVLLSRNVISFCFEPLSIFYDFARIKTMSLRSKAFVTISRLLYQPLDTYAIRHAAVLATLNTHVASYINRIYHRSPDVYLPNGVDHVVFRPKRRALNKNFVLLHSTDYTTLKGTELLIRSVARVVQVYPNIQVWISEGISNSSEKKRYVTLIQSLHLEDTFRFVGILAERDLPNFYRSGDALCYLGSPYCGGGSTASLSVVEAQACGTPVLRSLGGDKEIIGNKTGLYIHDYSETGVAKTILRFLRLSVIERAAVSNAASQYSKKVFSWEKTTRRLMYVIHQFSYV
jgi:glycosyltransferase involved in cell wall biosynthesis